MKISMNMLNWALRHFTLDAHIQQDQMDISRVRILPQSTVMENDCVYLSESREAGFFLLVHKKSIIRIMHEDFTEVMNAVLFAFDYFNDWERRLEKAAADHCFLGQMLDILEDVLGNSIILWTYSEPVMKYTDSRAHEVDELWAQSLNEAAPVSELSHNLMYDTDGHMVKELTDTPVLIRHFNPKGNPVIMFNLYYEKTAVAALTILQGNKTWIDMNLQLSAFAGSYLVHSRELSIITTVQDGEEILVKLMDGIAVNEEAVNKLSERLSGSFRLLIFSHVSREDILYKKSLIRTLKSSISNGVVTLYKNTVIAVIPESLCKNGLRHLNEKIDFANLSISVSMTGYNLKSIAAQYKQADFAHRFSQGQEGVHFCEDYAFEWLIRTLADYSLTESLIHPAIRILELYDEKNKGQLSETLSVFLKTEKNHSLTAKLLHIHPNTLKYRIKRIQELTGNLLEDGQDLSYLRLSDWLEKVKKAKSD